MAVIDESREGGAGDVSTADPSRSSGVRDRCLTVIVPVRNAEATIAAALEGILGSPYTGQVIVVDDGSTDRTGPVVDAIDDGRIVVVRHDRRRGRGDAIRSGIARVTMPFVLIQEADPDANLVAYDDVLGPLLAGSADAVLGSRFKPRVERRIEPFWRSLGSRAVTTLSNMSTNLNLTDVESSCKAFTRSAIQCLDLEQSRYGVEIEIVAKLAVHRRRVFEVGISCPARPLDDDHSRSRVVAGVVTVLCILWYSRVGPRLWRARQRAARRIADYDDTDNELVESLHSLSGAVNYADWIFDCARPHLGEAVIEVGAGHGDLTERLSAVAAVTALEVSSRSVPLLNERFPSGGRVEVLHADILDPTLTGTYDAAVAVNVLEHIADATGALARMRDLVRPGGKVIIFVPALEELYSEFDLRIGHVRRYRKHELEQQFAAAGLEPLSVRYMNLPGAIAWWLYAVRMGKMPTTPSAVQAFDRYAVPVIRRIESAVQMPFGQSLLGIAVRPMPSGGAADA